jgi:hypothetical protein
MTHKSRKNSCFEVLDGLFCELFQLLLFFNFWSLKPWIRIRIRIRIGLHPDPLDPDPNPDP